MTILKKLLIATLAFSMLGAFYSQSLVAMKRAPDGLPEGQRETKRRRQEVESQINPINPTQENFFEAIHSKNKVAIGQIIDQKPTWLTSGPLNYLTKNNADDLVNWLNELFKS